MAKKIDLGTPPRMESEANAPAEGSAKERRRVFRGANERPRKSAPSSVLEQRVKNLTRVAAVAVAVTVCAVAFALYAVVAANAEIAETRSGMTNVVVAASPIAAGEAIPASSLEVRAVPDAYVVDGALSDPAAFVGAAALARIEANSQITSSLVAGSANSSSLSGALAPGMKAVTVAVDEESGLAGLLHTGDVVSVVGTTAAVNGPSWTTLADTATVIALGGSIAAPSDGYTSVTVEVTDDQARAIRAAQGSSSAVSFVLSAAADNATQDEQGA